MFEVRNALGSAVYKTENFRLAKERADRNKQVTGENYTVVEIKDVYITSTLGEVVKIVHDSQHAEPNHFRMVRTVDGASLVVKEDLKRTPNDGYGNPNNGEYNAFLGDDGSDIPCD